MNEDELRALIRAAIQKHMAAAVPNLRENARENLRENDRENARENARENLRESALLISFSQYTLERANDDTACLIEPAVRCHHCGFCKCHGH